MDPWMIERLEQDRRRREREDRRVPLRIQQPPPDWFEPQQEAEQPAPNERGVWIVDL